ncbi:unnamed protein product [Dicrocoelium dendriticum]|nr:unnamed protein product [Dicrocoelium dendriticum]
MVESVVRSSAALHLGGSSLSSCVTTGPLAASQIQPLSSEIFPYSNCAYVNSQSQPQSSEVRLRRASLPVSPCRLPMKKRKFDWSRINATSDESNQAAIPPNSIVRSYSASPSCAFDSPPCDFPADCAHLSPVPNYQLCSPQVHGIHDPKTISCTFGVSPVLPPSSLAYSTQDCRAHNIPACPTQLVFPVNQDDILDTTGQVKQMHGIQMRSSSSSNHNSTSNHDKRRLVHIDAELNSEERTPTVKHTKSKLCLLVRSLTSSSNTASTCTDTERLQPTCSDQPHTVKQAQIYSSFPVSSSANLSATLSLTCTERSSVEPPSTQSDTCTNRFHQETQAFPLLATSSSALDTRSQSTLIHSIHHGPHVRVRTSTTNEGSTLALNLGHLSSASSAFGVTIHTHQSAPQDTKTSPFEHISSPNSAVRQSLTELHALQKNSSDIIAHLNSTLVATSSVMEVTSRKPLSAPSQPETPTPMAHVALSAAGAKAPSLEQTSVAFSLHAASATNAFLHSNKSHDQGHKHSEDLPSNARILMTFSPTTGHTTNFPFKQSDEISADVNRPLTLNSELNTSSFMRSLNGSKSGFPLLLVSASSSAGAAALAAAAALASGAPPTSLVPVPVQLITYIPQTTRSAPQSLPSPSANPKETTNDHPLNQRLVFSLCNP